ncbi:uncharacterized protein LOC109814108 [Cajanus cajan]|uniref:Uncharacterized protein n=1 Tax=Cajanus cajan TaxID=3821 RepID=A0A151S102_CAJCA|nr:uncharacterized protein LOC109814108 [Cajanus cajan]KYP48459.1 hypothetical protein KK1_029834 [Cajanus cajan]
MAAKNYGFLICILVMVLDIVAGILGIEAEIAQNKEKHMRVWIFECRYPSYHAFKLGLAAATFLALAHVIANLLGGCVCVSSTKQLLSATANRQLAVAFLIFSWIVLGIAFSMLMIGTLANSRSRKSNCAMLSHRFLSIGGILCFIHGLFIVPYYVSATATRREEEMSNTTQPATRT